MGKTYTFRAVIERGDGRGAFITVPFDVEQAFGKKRVKIKASIDGEPYRGSLVRMGGPCHKLGVLKEIREKIGKRPGDEVQVTLEEDTEPRVIEVPADLHEALKSSPEAEAFFQKLPYAHQREYVRWIEQAKHEQTRRDRIARAVEMLQQGKKEL
ncbi:MAG: YdeI/OmpD-associated family protein [Anaerolineales bacterium]|nr:YdeI/OmpD-associated family protein [Anaerolineales bacterium]